MDLAKQLQELWTLPILIVLFTISYMSLRVFLFKPYLAQLGLRKRATVGSLEEATHLSATAEHLAMDYHGKIKKQNEQAAHIYNQLKSEGQKEEERLIGEAKKTAQEIVDKTKKQIATEVSAAKGQLAAQIPELSRSMASRILGRELK